MPSVGERWQPAVRDKRYRQRKDLLPRLVTEGDSWFDYPPHPNVVDYVDDLERFAVLRFERSGDTLQNMAATIQKVAAAAESERPLCVLLSAGGNDVVEKGFIDTLFYPFDPLKQPRDYLKPAIWQAKLDTLEQLFVNVMHHVGPYAPMIVHGYDYMPPSPKGAKYDGFRVTGPWVHPVMVGLGIVDEGLQRAIVREMIEDFNNLLARLSRQYPMHFIHVDLRGVFEVKHWLNEIHLKRSGFKTVAKRIVAAIDEMLPAVVELRANLGIHP